MTFSYVEWRRAQERRERRMWYAIGFAILVLPIVVAFVAVGFYLSAGR